MRIQMGDKFELKLDSKKSHRLGAFLKIYHPIHAPLKETMLSYKMQFIQVVMEW